MADPRARVILESVRSGDAAFASFKKDLEGIAVKAELVADVIKEVVKAGLEYVKSTFEQIEVLAHQADALGISTKALAGLQLAARLSGVDAEQLNRALIKQTKAIYDASQGAKNATSAFAALHLDWRELATMSPDKQFATISEALNHVGNNTERAALLLEVFGAKNAAMLALVQRGSEGLHEAADYAEKFGTALSRLDAAKVEIAIEAIKLVQERMRGLGTIIAVEVAGDITALANAFIHTGNDADTMRVLVRNALNGIETGVGLVLDAYYGWHLLILKIEELSARAALHGVTDFETLENGVRHFLDMAGQSGLFGQGVARVGPSLATGLREDLQASVAATQLEIGALIAAGPPSAKLAENVGAARAHAEELAKHIASTVARRNENSGGTPIDTSAADAAARAKAQKARDDAERGVRQVNEAIRQGLQEEFNVRAEYGDLTIAQARELATRIVNADADAEKLALNNRLEQLREGLAQKVITEQEFYDKSADAAEASSARILRIEKQQLVAITALQNAKLQSVRSLTAAVADALTAGGEHSKADFEKHKKIALAAAIIDTIGAALSALRTVPFPANIAAAAAVAATGYAQVARIRATSWSGASEGGGSFSGGGAGLSSDSSGGGASGASLAAPLSAARSGTTINLVVQGSVIGEGGRTQLAEDLVRLLRDHVERTDDTLVTVTSRNGMDLAGAPA